MDSIYAQNLDPEDFEVICIDDASTDNTLEILHREQKVRLNLRVLHHETNKRQGGGRNTGMAAAEGNYLMFLDHDDIYLPNSLTEVVATLQKQHCLPDILMCDYITNTDSSKSLHYSSNSRQMMTGGQFMDTQQVPWVPWLCAFRTQFFRHHSRQFRECVLFEDTDFVLGCFARANSVFYSPIPLICYSVPGSRKGQTTSSNMIQLIDQRFQLLDAIKNDINDLSSSNDHINDIELSIKALSNHYIFAYRCVILEIWWRCCYLQRIALLKQHPIQYNRIPKGKNEIIAFAISYLPNTTNLLVSLIKPALYAMLYIRRIVKNRRK